MNVLATLAYVVFPYTGWRAGRGGSNLADRKEERRPWDIAAQAQSAARPRQRVSLYTQAIFAKGAV